MQYTNENTATRAEEDHGGVMLRQQCPFTNDFLLCALSGGPSSVSPGPD